MTSGFFRVHLWVLMGVQTLAALALYSRRVRKRPTSAFVTSMAVLAGGGRGGRSYIGAVIWMYERPRAGKIAICARRGAGAGRLPRAGRSISTREAGGVADWPIASRGGLLLGLVTTAMLLGHWYLNTPTMKLAPLQAADRACWPRRWSSRAASLRAGGWLEVTDTTPRGRTPLRRGGCFSRCAGWRGSSGVLGLAWLTWQTLKIPNTQSATGILVRRR